MLDMGLNAILYGIGFVMHFDSSEDLGLKEEKGSGAQFRPK